MTMKRKISVIKAAVVCQTTKVANLYNQRQSKLAVIENLQRIKRVFSRGLEFLQSDHVVQDLEGIPDKIEELLELRGEIALGREAFPGLKLGDTIDKRLVEELSFYKRRLMGSLYAELSMWLQTSSAPQSSLLSLLELYQDTQERARVLAVDAPHCPLDEETNLLLTHVHLLSQKDKILAKLLHSDILMDYF